MLFIILWANQPIRLIVENKSSNKLEDVYVTVGWHTLDFGKLESGRKKEKWFFYNGGDSSFKIIEDGHPLNDGMGYMTQDPLGFEFVYISINNNHDINFEQK